MPTAAAGSWLDVALAKGLIRREDLDPRPLPSLVDAAGLTVKGLVLPPAADCSEDEFQAKVVELATRRGFEVYHTHDSRRSAKGFPDLVLCKPGVLIFAELKRAKGKYSDAQQRWLALLETITGVIVCQWKPENWPEIVELLTAK